ncbi:MAG TPA: hypothetical protein VFW46_08365 [Stellaceae bacterium]|jgi:hypothetical protein|nr:hypothetical protein [Stellaceae bacterium]
MKQAITAFVVVLALFGGGRIQAADSPTPVPAQLAGNTLSAVAYVPWRPGLPGGGELARLVVQAYLRADGSSEIREWDPRRDAYTAPVERRWSLDGTRLCLDPPSGRICADVHVWGPRIAGTGSRPYAMLDGDLKPGNRISPSR